MTTIQSQITIHAPKEVVWQALSDLGGVNKYHMAVEKSYYSSDQKSGVGASRVCEFANGGSLSETVVRWQDGSSLTLSLNPGKKMPPFRSNSEGTFSVREDNGNTVVDMEMRYDLRFGFLGRLMDALMVRPQFSKIIPQVLAGLKYHIETGELVDVEVGARLRDLPTVTA